MVECEVILFPQPLQYSFGDDDQVSANIVVDACYIMLSLGSVWYVCYVILWVAFFGVNVAQIHDLLWGNEYSVSCLLLVEVCLQYIIEVVVLLLGKVLCQE